MTDNPWANPPPANGARLDHLKSSVVARFGDQQDQHKQQVMTQLWNILDREPLIDVINLYWLDFCKSNIGSGQNREDTLVRGNAEKQRNGYALPF